MHGFLHLYLPVRKNGALPEVFVKKYSIIITGYVSPCQENWLFLTESGTMSWSLGIFCYEMPSSWGRERWRKCIGHKNDANQCD
jgi:hypothetical protein